MLKLCLSGFHGTHKNLHAFARYFTVFFTTTSKSNVNNLTNSPIAEFLVESLGFTQEKAASIATKVNRRSESSKKPQLVVEFLLKNGFDDTQIRKVVKTIPTVLFSDVDKTLTPKIRAFQELGFSGSDLGVFISLHPSLLKRSLKGHTFPSIEILKSLMGDNQLLIRFLLTPKSQWFLSSSCLLRNLPGNVMLLQKSYGVPIDKMKWLLLRRPFFLLQRTQWVEKIVKGVEEKLGIPPTSGMFLPGVSALSRKSDGKLEAWLGVFRSFGWSEAEILELLGSQPSSLHASEEQTRVKLKYFMEDLGYGSDYLASHAALLSHSMEKRILPRTAFVQALKEKQLFECKDSYYTYVRMSECKFVEKYVLPVKDKLPELYESYTQKTGNSLT